jgi:3-methyladenine DNA glycosylase AlkD
MPLAGKNPSAAEIFDQLEQDFLSRANTARAEGMSRYMKNKFPFYGINSPTRKLWTKPYLPAFLNKIKQGELDSILVQTWEYEQREWQYLGLDLIWASRRYWDESVLDLTERLIRSKSWWDTVDMLATRVMGLALEKFPNGKNERLEHWIHSPDFWLNRTAIIHQLHYKKNTDTELLLACIRPHLGSSEFFIQKAIGWALRHYSRTNPEWVEEIATTWPLPTLSKREALRLIRGS